MSENRYNGSWLVARGSWLVARGVRFLYRVIRFIPRRIFIYYRKFFRYLLIISPNRRRLKNKNITIISKNCLGGVLLHELGLRFDTPTINLWFYAADFVKFCANLKYYIDQELVEYFEQGIKYPVGTLGEGNKRIVIYFLHYENFSQAKSKWDERKKRIHWDNLYFIMTDGDKCTEEIAREFDLLPYEHKALPTYRDLHGVKSAIKFKANLPFEGGGSDILAYKSSISIKRIFDDWDYVTFFNS